MFKRQFVTEICCAVTTACVFSTVLITGGFAAEPDALVNAIKGKDFARAYALLDQEEVNVNQASVDGMTPLHWAVYHDNLELSQRLVGANAQVDTANRYGVSALSLACANGNTEITRLLLAEGADANAEKLGGETALMTAARTGVLGPVKALIAAGADIHAKERKGQTAIMWAAAAGNVAVVDELIHAGADYRAALPAGFTPLLFAVREGHLGVVLRLLEAGVSVNEAADPRRSSGKGINKGTTPLILAVENGHFDLANALLEYGADPNDMRVGYSALHAITWVRKPIRGDGDPPPIGSGRRSSLDIVRLLVEHGANVNARHPKHKPAGAGRLNRTDATPFLLAAETGDLPLMKLLLDLGADPTLTNIDQCTPLLAAAGVGVLSDGDETAGTEEEAIEAITLLLELGADINAVDNQGKTAMHGAAFKSWTKAIQFLADNGADVKIWNRKNGRGWTPLLIAQGNRPGNFRPSAETIEAIEHVMRQAGVEPPQ